MAGEQILYERPLPGARLNCTHPLAQGLVGCWLFNDNGGTSVNDSSPYQRHGKLINFASPPRRAFNGTQFDGVDDYINVPGFHLPNLGTAAAFSVVTWFNWSGGGGGADGRRFICETSPNYTISLAVQAGSTPILRGIACPADTVGVSVDTTTIIEPNTVYHAALTSKQNYLDKIYLNGVMEAQSVTLNKSLISHTSLNIGTYRDAIDRWFAGSLHLLMIYCRDISAEEVKALYYSPYSPMEEPLFA
jgi:hypothetical protein